MCAVPVLVSCATAEDRAAVKIGASSYSVQQAASLDSGFIIDLDSTGIRFQGTTPEAWKSIHDDDERVLYIARPESLAGYVSTAAEGVRIEIESFAVGKQNQGLSLAGYRVQRMRSLEHHVTPHSLDNSFLVGGQPAVGFTYQECPETGSSLQVEEWIVRVDDMWVIVRAAAPKRSDHWSTFEKFRADLKIS